MQSQPQQENHDYASSTLPLTKREKRHHHSHETRPLGAPRALNPLQPPPGGYMQRRASIASPYTSPEHHSHQPPLDPIVARQYEKKRSISRGRRLPSTPMEEPYYRSSQEPQRPHSRAESMPDPLPIPWRYNIAPISQLARTPTARSPNPSPPPKPQSSLQEDVHNFKEPVGPPPVAHLRPSKKKGSLKPIRPKSVSLGSKNLSSSMDANLHMRTAGLSQPGSHTMSVMWPPQQQKIAPVGGRRTSTEAPATASLGWQSVNNIHRQTLPGTLGPRDIQGLMVGSSTPSSAYSSIRDIPHEIHQLQVGNESGSAVSVDIQADLFKPRSGMHPQSQGSGSPTRALTRSGDNLKVDPISGGEYSQKQHHHRSHTHHGHYQQHQHHTRSNSAKPYQQPPMGYVGGQGPEISSSLGYVGPGAELHYHQTNGDIHQYETEQVC